MTEESELLELLLDEVAVRLKAVNKELMDIITETLGQREPLDVIPTREKIRRHIREKVIRWLDYIKRWHNDKDDYVAQQIGVGIHTIRDEWRKPGRSLPNLRNYQALKALYNAERRLHGEPEE